MERYQDLFYRSRHARTVYAAETVLGVLLPHLPRLNTAIDVGCGVGTWLSVLANRGVAQVQGVDGPWVDVGNLVIPVNSFVHHDLRQDRDFGQRFDLAVSLEVAEHLPPERAAGFVRWLTLLSDIVLFSAATPRQGGKHHYNEQWQDYWAALFADENYVPLDFIRAKVWNDRKIDTWYRQNLLLYVRNSRLPDIHAPNGATSPGPLSIVHPEVFLAKADRPTPFGRWAKRLRKMLRGY